MGLQENMSETMGQLKQEHNLSTEEFSSKLDVSKASLQSYLCGRGNPSLGTVDYMAERLGIDPIILVSGKSANLSLSSVRQLLDTIATVVALPQERKEKFAELFFRYYRYGSRKDGHRGKVMKMLCRLGITATYHGFFYTAYAVQIARENPLYFLLVTKRLYPEVGKHFGTTAASVERAIRTVAETAWKRNRSFLAQIAQRKLHSKPKTSEFISILAYSQVLD